MAGPALSIGDVERRRLAALGSAYRQLGDGVNTAAGVSALLVRVMIDTPDPADRIEPAHGLR